jgi:putative MATE family efflux protein
MKITELSSPELRKTDRDILRLAVPCLLENLLTFAAGLVTSALIGRLSVGDVSTHGIGLRIVGLIQAVFRGIGVGATVIVGNYYGAGRLQQCRKTIEQTMLVVFVLSIVCAILVLLFPAFLIRLFTSDQALLEAAVPYLRTCVWLCPASALSRVVTAAFHGQGDTRTPLVIAITTNIVNAALCYVFVFGLGPVQAMGIVGAAWGLVISHLCGALLGLHCLYAEKRLYWDVHYEGKVWSIDRVELGQVFSTGLPASGEHMMWTFAAMVMGRVLLSYGADVYAGYYLASQCEEFLAAPAFAFQVAATALSAQQAGTGDRRRLREYYNRICALSTWVSLPIMLLMLFFSRSFMRVLTDKSSIQEIGALYITIAGVAYIPQILNMVGFGTVRAIGYKGVPILGAIIGMWGVRVPISVLAAWVFHLDIGFVFGAIAFDQVVRLFFVWAFMKRRKIMDTSAVPAHAGA